MPRFDSRFGRFGLPPAPAGSVEATGGFEIISGGHVEHVSIPSEPIDACMEDTHGQAEIVVTTKGPVRVQVPVQQN